MALGYMGPDPYTTIGQGGIDFSNYPGAIPAGLPWWFMLGNQTGAPIGGQFKQGKLFGQAPWPTIDPGAVDPERPGAVITDQPLKPPE